jgi:hypothetical protein
VSILTWPMKPQRSSMSVWIMWHPISFFKIKYLLMGLFLFSQMRTTTGSPSRVITLRRPWLLWGLLLKGIWMTTKVRFEFSSSWFRHQHPLILRQAIVWVMSIAICIARFARRSSAGSCTNVFNAKTISLCAGIARRPANIPNTSSYVSSETRY